MLGLLGHKLVVKVESRRHFYLPVWKVSRSLEEFGESLSCCPLMSQKKHCPCLFI